MLFEKLFDLENGYVHLSNMLFLNDVSFEESFDKNKLGYLINNMGDIETMFRDDARNLVALDKYYKKSKSNKLNVKYYQKDNKMYGRYQAEGSLSGQGMVREARHTIFKDYYVDVDMVNCHPVITLWLCEHLNIECRYLEKYVFARDKHINSLIKLNPDFDRDQIKKYMLAINYGCGDDRYNSLPNKNEFLIEYRKEIKIIQEQISNVFYMFRDINKENRLKRNRTDNLYGSTLSYICQFVENQLLMMVVNYLQSDKGLDVQDSILCFDGLMINKAKFKDEMVKDIERLFENNGIDIKMSVKDMDLDESVLAVKKYKASTDYKVEFAIDRKYLEFDDKYYYMDFMNDLTKNANDLPKIWDDFDELKTFFIGNVNRVIFRLLNNKGCPFFGRYDDKKIGPIELSKHVIKYKTDDSKIKSISFDRLIHTDLYNEIKEYNNLVFEPYTRDCAVKNVGPRDFNLFQGFQARLIEKEDIDHKLIEPVLSHWATVLADSDEKHFHYQLSYFHQIFKYPNRKTKVMLLFKSKKQQIGKGILINCIIGDLIFGPHLYRCNNGLNHITEKFNDDQAGILYSVSEELDNIDSSYNSTFNKLKMLCTEDNLNVEPKFGKKYSVKNYTNHLFNTNNAFSIKLEMGDARFYTAECDERYHKDYEYFDHLKNSINQEVANHLYSYIYHLDNPKRVNDIPNSYFAEKLKLNSCHSSIRFLHDTQKVINNMEEVEDNDAEYGYDSWQSYFLSQLQEDLTMKSSDVNNAFKLWCKENSERVTSQSRFKDYTEGHIEYKRNAKFKYYDFKTLDIPVSSDL